MAPDSQPAAMRSGLSFDSRVRKKLHEANKFFGNGKMMQIGHDEPFLARARLTAMRLVIGRLQLWINQALEHGEVCFVLSIYVRIFGGVLCIRKTPRHSS